VAIALLTSVAISIAGLLYTVFLGLGSASHPDLFRHVNFGLFSTLINLLAHSMTMFYLVGKGRAVKDAAAESGLSGRYAAEIARLRRPVFRVGTLAMAMTMITAILGASVDVQVLPVVVHGLLAYGALGLNFWAFGTEVGALTASARVVAEVDRELLAGASN
jgi:hypothetical protein